MSNIPMKTLKTRSLFGRLMARAASMALLAALLHGCAAQGDSAQVAALNGNGNGSGDGSSNGGGQADLGTAPVIDIEIKPTTLNAGGSITITWTTKRATSCTANGAYTGTVEVNNTSGLVLGPLAAGTYTYGVTCDGPGGSTSASQTVEVGAVSAPTVTLNISPASLQPGNSATLSWSTTNAATCVGTGGTGTDAWASNQPTNSNGFNTGAINTVGDYEYNLTCTGPGGSTEVSELIDVSASSTPAVPTITAFAASPTQILPGQSTTFSWSSNGTSCAASGGSGSDGWIGSEPTSSNGTAVGPIAAVGRYSYTLTCSGPGGDTSSTIDVTVSASTTPLPVSVSIGVLPQLIVAGTSASLTWSTINATACTASGSWTGSEPLLGAAVPTAVLTTAGTYTYTLTCVGSLGTSSSASTSLTVVSGPATVQNFAASPTTIVVGGSTSLSWSSNGASGCNASGGTGSDGWTGAVPTSSTGTAVGPITTAGIYTYSLTCTGPGGTSAPQSVNVAVSPTSIPAATVTSLVATPSSLQVGGSASLSWVSANATSCIASGGLGGSDGWTGSVGTASAATAVGPFTAANTYTYTLTCTGSGGTGTATSVAINVTAAPTPAGTVTNFLATPSTILVGQAASLSWGSDASTSCTASNGTGSAWSGTMPASSLGTSSGNISTVGSYTFTLTCMGPGGAGAPSSVTVNVIPSSGTAAAIVSFNAASTNLSTGQSTILSWATLNATSCAASNGSGFDSWAGSEPTASASTPIGPFTAAGIYTYTLNCIGSGGASGPSSVTINVSTPPAQATVTTFIATPTTLQAGGFALLSWTTSGATSCDATGGPPSSSWTGAEPTLSLGTSTGVIATAGSYTYILTCTGAAGVGPSSSVIVNVTSAPPPAAAVSSFAATPNSIVVGQSTSLAWSTTNATSCAATGGTMSDGWNGSVGTSSTGTSTGAIGTAGIYTYFLTCTGPGGTSLPATVVVDVSAAAVAPSIIAFAVTPSTVQTGQSALATWATLNATACTASGGASGDGWGGNVGASSLATTIGPETTAGTYTYSLTCTGAGGTSAASTASLTVVTTPVAPTISSFTASPVAIQTGGTTKLSWSTTNASSCAAGGGASGDGWSGSNIGTSSAGTTVGPISVAGIYTYTLTCTGAGGATSTGIAVVTVTTATPPASIVAFLATPTTTTTGGSVILTWVTSGASACTASGGTGSDGWSGSQSPITLGKTVGPLNTAGVYVYTLNCTGPGGASLPSSATVTVTSATPAATVSSFAAAPSTVSVGQSTALAWTSTNATSCTASGGTGADGWSGAEPPSSNSTIVGPFATAGSVVYKLTCTGTGGTSAVSTTIVTVVAPTAQQPTVSLMANGHTSLSIQTGASATMSWTSSNATACTASGGAGSDGWPGSRPTSSSSFIVGPVNTPGTYTYTLSCSGAGGSGSSTVTISVMSANSADCGIPGLATASLVSPAASVINTIQGLCAGCSVANPTNVINSATTSPSVITELLGALGGDVLMQINQPGSTYPAGRTVGFVLTSGSSLLNLSLLQNITLKTYLNGVPAQTATTANNLITLQALGLLSVNPNAGFAGFTATLPFNSVSLEMTQLVGLNTTVNVYRACVSQ